MSVAKTTNDLKDARLDAGSPRNYGVPSWLFFAVAILVNIGFVVTQWLVNNVRAGDIAIARVEEWFFPGAYWVAVSGNVVLLMLSAVMLALTLALIVVRAWLHLAPCRIYGVMLLLQTLPWLYFASAHGHYLEIPLSFH